MSLGVLSEKLGRFDNADYEFKAAMLISVSQEKQDQTGERVSRDALARLLHDASLQYAMGFAMIGENTTRMHCWGLRPRVHYDRNNPRRNYVYTVALDVSGRGSDAIATLGASLRLSPYDRDSLASLVEWIAEPGNSAEAPVYTTPLEQREPDHDELQNLIADLRVDRTH